MNNCCSKFLLSILSLVTVGLITAASALALYFIDKYEISAFDNSILIWVIVILCVSILVLIFSLVASCSESGCLGFLLGIIFLVFTAGVIACAVFILVYEDKLWETIGKAWDPTNPSVNQTIHVIEENFDCSGWDKPEISEERTCHTLFQEEFDKYKVWIVVGFFVAAILLGVGVVLSFCKMCHKSEYAALDRKPMQQEQPLSYGW